MAIERIEKILKKEKSVIFAYLYGSFLYSRKFNDIDIAVYLKNISFGYIADLKIKLAAALKMPSDLVDITILNGILESADAFSLLYLERVLKDGRLIVNQSHKIWTDFLEEYSNKSRASEAILDEVR